ncbi:PTS system ascorbate-specific IIA component [Sporomusaceae bacterium BoRhaA]|uniref:PTS sugar transporter subunit IIA n=1 Tax=Pelorhabdus rhamnosifermentans TaxID=2772457 RepID=UPI001C060251|nr:PTS sugar transporter subunit IIA [Pelorhabdus rhamnosifermentans]MBU2700878.1 PTS system ascorbate-specific IIA component [Pelorhabdus rhamnosifermentans]
MFKQLIEQQRVTFAEKFERWEDAVAAAAQPLVRDGAIDTSYITAMIDSIHKFGPYIVIAPNLAMPHAKGGSIGVHETAISFMKVHQPVHFGDSSEQDAQLLFVVASVDDEAHLGMLQALVEAISVENFLERLGDIQSLEDLQQLISE